MLPRLAGCLTYHENILLRSSVQRAPCRIMRLHDVRVRRDVLLSAWFRSGLNRAPLGQRAPAISRLI
jgi:hypothetical protein